MRAPVPARRAGPVPFELRECAGFERRVRRRAERVVVHVRPRGAAVGLLRVVFRAERLAQRGAPWRRPASAAATASPAPSGRSSRAVAPRRAGRRRPTRAPPRRRRPRPPPPPRACSRPPPRRREPRRARAQRDPPVGIALHVLAVEEHQRQSGPEAAVLRQPPGLQAPGVQRVRAGRGRRRRRRRGRDRGRPTGGPAVGAGAGRSGHRAGGVPGGGRRGIRGGERGRGGERVRGRARALPRDQHARRVLELTAGEALHGRTRFRAKRLAHRGVQVRATEQRHEAQRWGQELGRHRHILRARRGGHRRAGRPRRRGRDARAPESAPPPVREAQSHFHNRLSLHASTRRSKRSTAPHVDLITY